MNDSSPQVVGTRRERQKKVSAGALVLAIIGGCFGFINPLTKRVSPQPDYYKLLFTEVARQASLQTGTPIIVKNIEGARALFEREFNRRNARFHISDQPLPVPRNEVFGGSYAPGVIEQTGLSLIKTPLSKLWQQYGGITVYKDEPGLHPLVVWIYSKSERLMAAFFSKC